jgi:hypothetical protein
MHSRVKGINEIQAIRSDLEKKTNQITLNTLERKNDEVGIPASTSEQVRSVHNLGVKLGR